ncbi:UNVERIFIED_ORG: Flp pilus assembly secretin CpaC [Agrobacterium larrymoorei]|nr:Flp pilus assembly secretin CpaC [Agrobacterium larrymoorei]
MIKRHLIILRRFLSLHSPFPFMVVTMKCAKHNQRSVPLMLSSTIKRFAVAVVILGFAPAFALSADDEMLRVSMNQARVLKLDRAVSKVIVGNSKVADATVADATTIVLTGRSFGTTNLVLLDADGNAIVDERVLVSIDEGNTVRVYRQTSRSVLSCSPACEEHAQN